MAEREFINEVIIDENGALKTYATYYKGHLPLDQFINMGGQHWEGFTGPETRFVTKRLMAHIVEPMKVSPVEEVHAVQELKHGQEVILV